MGHEGWGIGASAQGGVLSPGQRRVRQGAETQNIREQSEGTVYKYIRRESTLQISKAAP